jgi:hypothetical protein
VIGFLRIVGLVNAAIWFGAAVFFTFGVAPAVFSQDMRQLLGPGNYPYFSGAIAQMLISTYFDLQVVCALVAVFHAFAEWLYLSRPLHRFWTGLLAVLLLSSLLGALLLQPHMKKLHQFKYSPAATPAQRVSATSAFKVWHGTSQAVNLLMLAGLGLYLWRTANPSNATRFRPPGQVVGLTKS